MCPFILMTRNDSSIFLLLPMPLVRSTAPKLPVAASISYPLASHFTCMAHLHLVACSRRYYAPHAHDKHLSAYGFGRTQVLRCASLLGKNSCRSPKLAASRRNVASMTEWKNCCSAQPTVAESDAWPSCAIERAHERERNETSRAVEMQMQ